MSAPRSRGHRRAGPLRAHVEARHFGLEAATIAAIAAASTAVAAAGTATSQIVQARQSSDTAKYNEEVQSQQAELARRAGESAEADTRKQAARAMAIQRAQLGDSGITTEGTPLLLLLDSAQEAEMESLRARYSGQVNVQAARANEQLYRQRGQQARFGGTVGAGTTLLTGATKAYGAYTRPPALGDPRL